MNNKRLSKVLHKKGVISFIILIISIRILVPMIIWYMKVLEKCFDKQYNLIEINNLSNCFKAIIDNKTIALIYIIIAIILILSIYTIYFTRKRIKTEREGITFKNKDGTHGTANFIEAEEIDILKIGDEENTPGIILGKTLETNEVITLPDTCKSINRNVMIWGSSGSGKSTSYIIPNALKITDQEKNKFIREFSSTREKCSVY